MSMTQVYQWCSWFKDGRTSLQDESRSGRPNTANNDWNTARVDELIKVDRRVKLKEISLKLDIPKTNVYEIVHNKHGYRKLSARWVPKMLSDEHKHQSRNLPNPAPVSTRRLDIIPHPAHNPDLAPSDFHLFGPLKRHLEGKKFEDVIGEVRDWLSKLDANFFTQGIYSLLPRVALHGNYIEK
ncbi:histone-lysine N-methyltransferase SETMAR [Plakobranchus ocellatus]|uniref:Histone-lysine N-methyltransferase SETMAR n=1 Tax=Plakobranchus ocellatus TaxID=259542 RepID=A0AAV4BTU5_9GAST|nr:histone-lysine N-methyltransferase SETMAR [Plakobranchus ocellatus]